MATIFIPNPPQLQPRQTKATLRGKHWWGAMMLAAMIVLTALLCVWQLWRAHEKQLQLAEIARLQSLPLMHWNKGVPPLWRPVQLQGQWLPQYEIWLDHRVRAGKVGYHIITPFQLQDGVIVMVNRGWWNVQEQGVPPTPKTTPKVVAQAWPRYLELGGNTVEGRVFQNLDPGRFAAWAYLPMPEAYALADQASSGLLAIEPERPFGVARHWAYALTWGLLALIGGYLLRRHYLRI